MKVLVAYASKHGATEGIAMYIAERFREGGRDAEARKAEDVTDLEGVEVVVLGSAVYAGSWMNEAMEFVHRHAEALDSLPVWLFSSGPLGEQIKDGMDQIRQLAELRETLQPKDHHIFFGALDREKLGFGERMIVKAVKAPDGDFRDWDEIGTWTEAIAAELG
ncbi:MAG: flavodoxin domain-containing protein [Actinomycetota bacterium]